MKNHPLFKNAVKAKVAIKSIFIEGQDCKVTAKGMPADFSLPEYAKWVKNAETSASTYADDGGIERTYSAQIPGENVVPFLGLPKATTSLANGRAAVRAAREEETATVAG